jgi:hypothetical protein
MHAIIPPPESGFDPSPESAFAKEILAVNPPAGSRPVFVVGAPRTGTTLVRDILNRHPEVHLFDEVHFFERIWDERARWGDLSDPDARRAAIDRLLGIVQEFGSDKEVTHALTADAFAERMQKEGGSYAGLLAALLKTGAELKGATIWGDSSPQDVLYLPKIFEWFPDARVIALVRDPRDFLSSYKNYHRRGVASYRERYNPLTNSILWRSSMTAVLEAGSAPWGQAVLRMRYEDLVREPDAQVRRLCAHVGITYIPDMLDVPRSNSSFTPDAETTAKRGITRGSIDRWKTSLTPTEIWIAERITGRCMDEFEYERTSNQDLRPSPVELLSIGAMLPSRLFNLLFRSHKPFRLAKVRRVFSLFRAG